MTRIPTIVLAMIGTVVVLFLVAVIVLAAALATGVTAQTGAVVVVVHWCVLGVQT